MEFPGALCRTVHGAWQFCKFNGVSREAELIQLECIVKGVRDGSELREDRTRLLVQEIQKTAEKQKSFIAPK